MRIIVDINHPADVNFFRNLIDLLKEAGHDILITASKKDISLRLLDSYNIDYRYVGSYGENSINKLINLPIIDKRMYHIAKNFSPDLFLGFASIRSAHVSRLMNKPYIAFDDTEHAKLGQALYVPFTKIILTPSCFKKNLGKSQIFFNSYKELAYLYPKYFKPSSESLDKLNFNKNDLIILLRFVSWTANHDLGHNGLSYDIKRKAIKEFSKVGNVIISSEVKLPREFENFQLTDPSINLHDIMNYSALLYGESATMASECAVLGTHSVYTDFKGRGYTDEEEERYGLVSNFKLDAQSQNESIENGLELLADNHLQDRGRKKRDRLLEEKMDLTSFMLWMVEEFPDSIYELRANPKIQNRFL